MEGTFNIMFIIVQNIISAAHQDVDDFDCFNLLTTPTGFPMKFSTEGEAVSFLSSLDINETSSPEEGEIRIDRVH